MNAANRSQIATGLAYKGQELRHQIAWAWAAITAFAVLAVGAYRGARRQLAGARE
jgi:hypothetical protein